MTIGSRSLLAAAVVAGFLLAGSATLAATAPPFPASVSGWARTDDVRSFDASNLYQYIDGDAEKYIKAGVKSAATADYSFRGKVDAVADVYTMSDANGARTIFESDAAGNARAVALGDAARAYSQSLVFRKGAYLVRIVAYQEGPEVPQALIDLGHGIERQLGN
jgi:hypothetical protein